MNKPDHILVVSDTHIPFEHPDYLDFCLETQERFKCGTVVHIGDLVDNHSISYHDHDPDGRSPADEMAEADRHLISWFLRFPKVFLCRGNHDCLIDRKSKTVGLPSRAFRSFREMWRLPKGWVDAFEFEIDGVIYQHGTGRSGKLAHMQAAFDNRQSTVIGHTHSQAGVEWMANSKQIIFGLNVGCGINRKSYAFAYGKDFAKKPILGCGLVTDRGRFSQFIPMRLK